LAFYNLACAQSLRKEIPEAYQALEKAFQAGYSNLIQLQADADLANLRADEGYAAFLAQHSPGGPILPLTYPEQRRMFDFMIGEWDLFQGNNLIGQTSVSCDLNRQVIQSRLAGQSFSTMTYVEKEDLWRQTWMSTNGHHDILEGGLENGMPVMYQKLLRDRPGFIGRATFGNIAENSYDSYWDISPDGGKTWQRQWQGQFRRQTMQRESSKYSLKGMSKEAAQETEQYAFKLGTWDIKARSRTPNGGVTEGVGSSLVYFAEDGQTILDDIAVSFNGGGGFSGTTSRRWSSEKGLWECSWTQVGAQTQPFTAVYDGEAGRMVESFRGQDANGAFSGKLSFYDVSADSLHVRLDYHYDSGVVAEGVWEYIAHRTPE